MSRKKGTTTTKGISFPNEMLDVYFRDEEVWETIRAGYPAIDSHSKLVSLAVKEWFERNMRNNPETGEWELLNVDDPRVIARRRSATAGLAPSDDVKGLEDTV